MSEPSSREDSIVDAALELPPEQRSAHLDRECAGDPHLREIVEALLRAHRKFNAPAAATTLPVRGGPRAPVAPESDEGGSRTKHHASLSDYHPGERIGH